MPRAKPWRRCERGQSTPLVMASLFALTLFTAVVVNVGQAVNRRVALQLVADTGAFTGASVMASGLNNIAYWNGLIQEIWAPMTWVAAGFIVSPLNCGTNESASGYYDTGRSAFGVAINLMNIGYASRAYGEANRVTAYNAADLFPGERIRGVESDMSPDVAIARARPATQLYSLQRVPYGTWPRKSTFVPPLAGARRTVTWGCVPETFRWPWTTHSFDPWLRRAPGSRPAYFVWIVKAPPTRAVMFNDVFARFSGTPYAIPEMKAAAAAKPVGGSIEAGDARYVAKMVPLTNVMASGRLGLIYDTFAQKVRRVWH